MSNDAIETSPTDYNRLKAALRKAGCEPIGVFGYLEGVKYEAWGSKHVAFVVASKGGQAGLYCFVGEENEHIPEDELRCIPLITGVEHCPPVCPICCKELIRRYVASIGDACPPCRMRLVDSSLALVSVLERAVIDKAVEYRTVGGAGQEYLEAAARLTTATDKLIAARTGKQTA